MIGLFLVTHGTLGEALIQCVCHVLDKRPPLLGQLGLSAGEDPADALPLARRMIATVDDGEGVLLLADLYGATPVQRGHAADRAGAHRARRRESTCR
jgi:PTS system mannose-specific IIA component